MKTIPAGQFKTHCLALLDTVADSHEPLVITKHGKPVAKLLPYDTEKEGAEAPLRGMATFVGDIISPVGDEWEAAES